MVHRICIIPGIMGYINGTSRVHEAPYLRASITVHYGVLWFDRVDFVHGHWGMSHSDPPIFPTPP